MSWVLFLKALNYQNPSNIRISTGLAYFTFKNIYLLLLCGVCVCVYCTPMGWHTWMSGQLIGVICFCSHWGPKRVNSAWRQHQHSKNKHIHKQKPKATAFPSKRVTALYFLLHCNHSKPLPRPGRPVSVGLCQSSCFLGMERKLAFKLLRHIWI